MHADDLFRDRRANAAVGWTLVSILLATVGWELLSGGEADLIWAGFAAVVAAVAVLPAMAYLDSEVMPPWEVLLVATLPILGRAFLPGQSIGPFLLTGVLATYLAVAAVALIVAVEIHSFTPVRMTVGFAVVFVVVTTMAMSGVWAVARGAAEWWFGWQVVPSEHRLGLEFVYSTIAGVGAGVVFEYYFRRRAPVTERIPDEIVEEIEAEIDDFVDDAAEAKP